MRITLVAALFALVLSAQDAGVISGVLHDSVTGAPVADASVLLVPASRQSAALKQKSGAGGEFRFEALAPGAYMIAVTKRGYMDSTFADGPSWPVRVKAGAEEQLDAAIVPAGAIEGRVFDEDAKPLKGVLVYAEREGAPSVLAISEDQGRYRVDNLAPGQYRIEVRVPYALRKETARRDSDSGEFTGYANTQFYPGVFDASAAAVVAVSPANVVAGFDLKLRRTLLVTLSGHAADGVTREAMKNADVALAPESGGLADNTYDKRPLGAGGAFRFDLIRPGRYSLLFYRERAAGELPYSTSVEVGRNGDEHHAVTVPAAATIRGHIALPVDKSAEWGKLSVALLRPSGSRTVEASDNGDFVIEPVPPGSWKLRVMPPKDVARDWYVAAVRFGPLGIAPGAELMIVEGENPPVEIVLSAEAAEIGGAVVDAKQHPARNALVVLRGASAVAASQRISYDGTFSMPGLAPGEYTVTAVPGPAATDWLNGTITSCGSKTVHVAAAPRERRVLKLELCSGSPN